MAHSPNKPVPPPRDHRTVVEAPDQVSMTPIGVVHSPYKERHGTPRQAGIKGRERARSMEPGQVELFLDQVPAKALRDIEGFDRIWLLTYLHLNPKWGPLVRPPRGGIRRGVFATRSTHRQ